MGGGTLPQRLSTIRKVTRLYTTCVAPRVISGAVPIESAAHAALHSPLLILGALCILVTATLVAFSFLSQDQWLLRVRRLVGLPLLFGACTALIFCASTVSASGLLSTCNADFAGRYATPLVLALPFFFAAVFTMARMSISVGAGVGMTWGGGLYGRPPSPRYAPHAHPLDEYDCHL